MDLIDKTRKGLGLIGKIEKFKIELIKVQYV